MKQKTGVFAVLTATLLLGTMVGVGCGGDDDTTGGSTGGSGGTAGSAGSGGGKGGSGGSTGGASGTGGGGTGGTTDGGGKGGTAGSAGADAGSDAPTTIPCGTSMCGPIVTGNPALGTLQPCCPMDVPNACGGTAAILMGACLTKTPGTADATCPGVPVLGGVATLPGCCRPNGMCGGDVSMAMLGCNDPAVFGAPAAGPCGGGGDGGPVDAPRDTGGNTDTGTTDTGGNTDTGTTDTGGGTDTGTTDTGTTDTGTTDSAPPSDAPAG